MAHYSNVIHSCPVLDKVRYLIEQENGRSKIRAIAKAEDPTPTLMSPEIISVARADKVWRKKCSFERIPH